VDDSNNRGESETVPTGGRPQVRRATVRLGVLVGLVYFAQGVADPTEGLATQPALSLLKSAGRRADEIAHFSAMLTIPWVLKPLYGLLSDLVPLAGTRRKSYLILASVVTGLAFLALDAFPGLMASYRGWLMRRIRCTGQFPA
jgi:hypothetical protein